VRFGVSADEARAYVSAKEEKVTTSFGVWAKNVEALNVFFRMRGQWRLHPFTGKALALDHGLLVATLQLMGVPETRWPALFEQVDCCADVVLKAT